MKEAQPSIKDWQCLYDAVVEFKKLKCWDWVLDSDVFGVQNPANGEIGYCCITGKLGEHFALVVYLGTEGLEIYLDAQSGRALENPLEMFVNQKCLMASFEDREILSKEDRVLIRKLGLRFRGAHQWPQFRSYQPGYAPWYLTKDEVEYLISALQQASEVALRFREDPDMLIPPERGNYLIRVSEKVDGRYQWTDEWLEPQPLEEEPADIIPPINEIRLQKIKKAIKRRGGSWETDFFFTPTPIKEGEERPYYPYAILYVDSHTGIVLTANVMKPADYMTEIPNSLMELIEGTRVIPNEILVKKEKVSELVNLIVSRLGIRLKLVDRLEMLEQAQFSMLQFFR